LTESRLGVRERGLAVLLALAALAVLITAAWLTPAHEGHGTHEELGLPACMWAARFDQPCMTCGMTTSFAYAANGNILGSLRAQPMGMLLAIGTSVGFWIALYVGLTGSRIGIMAGRALTTRVLVIITALALAAWVYKIITWHSIRG